MDSKRSYDSNTLVFELGYGKYFEAILPICLKFAFF